MRCCQPSLVGRKEHERSLAHCCPLRPGAGTTKVLASTTWRDICKPAALARRTWSTASVSCFTAATEAQPTARGYASSVMLSSSARTALQAAAEPWLSAASAAAAAALASRSCSGAQ